MPPIIIECEQGSERWFREKLGKPSASRFSEIITTKGDISKSRESYMYELAAESVSGIFTEGYKNANMQEGNDRESESRALYELINGVEVEQVGVIYRDEFKMFLCSPDGLVNREWGLELKNVLPKTQVKYLLAGTLPTDYFQQVQGSLYITGFDRWDFMAYSPGLPPLILPIRRDEAFIAKLETALLDFAADLSKMVDKLRAMR
jgi:hypothetical protein